MKQASVLIAGQAGGMQMCKTVVAINKDAEAPIFDLAESGMIGDRRYCCRVRCCSTLLASPAGHGNCDHDVFTDQRGRWITAAAGDVAHTALLAGRPKGGVDIPVQLCRSCLAREALGPHACPCGRTAESAMLAIATEGRGIVLHLRPATPPSSCAEQTLRTLGPIWTLPLRSSPT